MVVVVVALVASPRVVVAGFSPICCGLGGRMIPAGPGPAPWVVGGPLLVPRWSGCASGHAAAAVRRLLCCRSCVVGTAALAALGVVGTVQVGRLWQGALGIVGSTAAAGVGTWVPPVRGRLLPWARCVSVLLPFPLVPRWWEVAGGM